MKNLLLACCLIPILIQAQPPECVLMIADSAEWNEYAKAIKDFTNKTNEILDVQVVVHVIHNGAEYGTGANITNEQIQSAIIALNEDFRKFPGSNGDGIGVDVGIQFCLATIDPNGNPHSGINRVNGCSIPNYCSEGIASNEGVGASETQVKNLSRWPNQEYYNIWVVTEIENNDGGSGIQGYSYFPTTSLLDGTVVLFNAFGTIGNLKSYTNMNRTLTHEIGHAFALFHTWGSGSSGAGICDEVNCIIQGDRVCDTPPTTGSENCTNGSCEGTSMPENYMSYASQACKNAFTAGQRDRMRAAASATRANLIAAGSASCTADCETNTDFSGDGILNLSDVSMMNEHYNCEIGQTCYNALFDLNCDGVINVVDVSMWNAAYSLAQ